MLLEGGIAQTEGVVNTKGQQSNVKDGNEFVIPEIMPEVNEVASNVEGETVDTTHGILPEVNVGVGNDGVDGSGVKGTEGVDDARVEMDVCEEATISHTVRQGQGRNKGKSVVMEPYSESDKDDSDDETFVQKFIDSNYE